jgi:hypothetical protein
MHLFIGFSYTSAAHYPMDDRDIIDTGLCQALWNVCQGVQKLDLTQERGPTNRQDYQLLQGILGQRDCTHQSDCCPALQHGYGLTAMDNDALVAAYNDLLANFGAKFAATQETMKSQANGLVAMQNQLSNN